MPLTRAEHVQIRQAIALMGGVNFNGYIHVSKKDIESLLDKYTEDFVNSLNEDPGPVEFLNE